MQNNLVFCAIKVGLGDCDRAQWCISKIGMYSCAETWEHIRAKKPLVG